MVVPRLAWRGRLSWPEGQRQEQRWQKGQEQQRRRVVPVPVGPPTIHGTSRRHLKKARPPRMLIQKVRQIVHSVFVRHPEPLRSGRIVVRRHLLCREEGLAFHGRECRPFPHDGQPCIGHCAVARVQG